MTTAFNKANPFTSSILSKTLLNKAGSERKVYHIILDIQNSNLTFSPGDSAGIFPVNDPLLVHKTLHALKAKGEELIIHPQTKLPLTLKDFLSHHANISKLPLSFLELLKPHKEIQKLLEENLDEKKTVFLWSFELWDLIQTYPIQCTLQTLCDTLASLAPRYYSIASAQKSSPNRIELIVSDLSYITHNQLRHGVCSHFLCSLAEIGKTQIPLFIHHHPHFSLPQDPNSSMIMFGAGTGLSPFRAFLQERLLTHAKGKNWLFFGEQKKGSDFYFQDFILGLVEKKFLHLTTAFSRDQEKKIYIQHRLLERKKEVFQWIEEGAYLYLCGDAKKMAKDVEKTLIQIVKEEKNISEEAAGEYFKNLRKQKRYLKDVY